MQVTKVFVASSIVEFSRERTHIGAFVHRLNQVTFPRRRIRLYLCEDESKQVSSTRSQDALNEHIHESSVFLMLVGQQVGPYTLEELSHALASRQGAGKAQPRIVIAVNTTDDPRQVLYELLSKAEASEDRADHSRFPVQDVLGHVDNIMSPKASLPGDAVISFATPEEVETALLGALVDIGAVEDNLLAHGRMAQDGQPSKTDGMPCPSASFVDSEGREVSRICVSTTPDMEDEICELEDFGRYLCDALYASDQSAWVISLEEQGRWPRDASRELEHAEFLYLISNRSDDEGLRELFHDSLAWAQEEPTAREGVPRTFAYVRARDDGQGGAPSPLEAKAQTHGYYYGTYDSIDTIKYHMVCELVASKGLRSLLSTHEGDLYCGDVRLMGLKLVPAYTGAINELQEAYEAADRKLQEAFERFLANPQDDEAQRVYRDCGNRRAEALSTLRAAEASVINLSVRLAEMPTPHDEGLARTQSRARRLLEEGLYEEAVKLLSDSGLQDESDRLTEQQQKDDAQHEALRSARRSWQQDYLQGLLTSVDALGATGVDDATVSRVVALYERCMRISEAWGLDEAFVMSYLAFLCQHGRAQESLRLAKRRLEHLDASDLLATARAHGSVAYSYASLGRYREALPEYLLEIDAREKLAMQGTDTTMSGLASALANTAQTLKELGRTAEAIPLFERALEIRERLVQKGHAPSQKSLAGVLINLGNAYSRLGNDLEAYRVQTRTVAQLEGSEDRDLDGNEQLAKALNNLSITSGKLGYDEVACDHLVRAIEIREKAAATDPLRFEPILGLTYANLARRLMRLDRLDEAERLLAKAAGLLRRNAPLDHAKTDPMLSSCLESYAQCLQQLGRMQEASDIREELREVSQRLDKLQGNGAAQPPKPDATTVAPSTTAALVGKAIEGLVKGGLIPGLVRPSQSGKTIGLVVDVCAPGLNESEVIAFRIVKPWWGRARGYLLTADALHSTYLEHPIPFPAVKAVALSARGVVISRLGEEDAIVDFGEFNEDVYQILSVVVETRL